MFLLRWLILALTMFVIGWYMPGVEVASIYTALIVAVIFGILNLLIKPILMLFTLPITILTLGLSALVFNAIFLWFIASFVEGFTIDSFGTALIVAVILWLVSIVLNLAKKASKVVV